MAAAVSTLPSVRVGLLCPHCETAYLIPFGVCVYNLVGEFHTPEKRKRDSLLNDPLGPDTRVATFSHNDAVAKTTTFLVKPLVSSSPKRVSEENKACEACKRLGLNVILSTASLKLLHKSVILGHGVPCPVEKAKTVREDKSLRLGAVAMLKNENEEYLLTRRPDSMRSFPKAWVFPGGSVDPGESVTEAALRELKEETGLDGTVQPENEPVLRESVFPSRIQYGAPRSHFLVVYYPVVLHKEHTNWRRVLRPSPNEVDCVIWVGKRQLAVISGQTKCFKTEEKTVCSEDVLGVTVRSKRTAVSPSSAVKHIVMEETTVHLKEVCGIYPNAHASGVGGGHLFAVRALFRQQEKHE